MIDKLYFLLYKHFHQEKSDADKKKHKCTKTLANEETCFTCSAFRKHVEKCHRLDETCAVVIESSAKTKRCINEKLHKYLNKTESGTHIFFARNWDQNAW